MSERALIPPEQFGRTTGWIVITPKDADKSKHVLPAGDLRAHECSGQCWCRPRFEDEGDILVHNSMDGRERHEQGDKTN